MELLKELMALNAEGEVLEEKEKKKPLKKAAASVYHRDYVKTKNKPYRKYDKAEYERNKGE